MKVEVFRDESPKRPPITVLCPAIGADESEDPILAKQSKRALDEGNVEIGSIVERGVELAVLGDKRLRDQLLANIRRVADYEIEFALYGGKKKVAGGEPVRCKARGLGIGDALLG